MTIDQMILFETANNILDQIHILFDVEWDNTKQYIESGKFIGRRGTFLRPDVEDEAEKWPSRAKFLSDYRRLRNVRDSMESDFAFLLASALRQAGFGLSADALQWSRITFSNGKLVILAPPPMRISLKDPAVAQFAKKLLGVADVLVLPRPDWNSTLSVAV